MTPRCSWSKRAILQRLLAGVDREAVAIVYTSDHGQNLTPGALPHCSREAVADEFRVPLLAFLPRGPKCALCRRRRERAIRRARYFPRR
jgi:glucan phosphoethanolaminetransferase (alkaline phosphatase superfamily)